MFTEPRHIIVTCRKYLNSTPALSQPGPHSGKLRGHLFLYQNISKYSISINSWFKSCLCLSQGLVRVLRAEHYSPLIHNFHTSLTPHHHHQSAPLIKDVGFYVDWNIEQLALSLIVLHIKLMKYWWSRHQHSKPGNWMTHPTLQQIFQ